MFIPVCSTQVVLLYSTDCVVFVADEPVLSYEPVIQRECKSFFHAFNDY